MGEALGRGHGGGKPFYGHILLRSVTCCSVNSGLTPFGPGGGSFQAGKQLRQHHNRRKNLLLEALKRHGKGWQEAQKGKKGLDPAGST